jgi:hypothetical protein
MDYSPKELDKIAELSKILKWKKSRKFYADRLGVTEKQIKELLKEARKLNRGRYSVPDEGTIKKENLLKGTLESIQTLTFEPKTHKELAIVHNVDLSKFTIINYWSKLKSNGKYTSSIFCKRRTSEDYSAEDFQKFLKKYKSNYIPIKTLPIDRKKDTVDVELSISDLHLAKKYVTEKNKSIKKRVQKFYSLAENLMLKVSRNYNIDTVVFPISNDFFHSDTYWNTTTAGTQQDVIAEYDEEYEAGFDLLVKTISLLKSLGKKVVIVLVQGNHDRTKSFYLAHGLEVYFRSDKDINFLRDSSPTKSVKIGDTFIGYHHGNCKIEQLPLLFATNPESSKTFGSSKFREVHTGDKHHYMAKEIKGVRIQQMPSLSGTDKWHRDNQYVNNIRAALVLLYDKKKGKTGEFEERI